MDNKPEQEILNKANEYAKKQIDKLITTCPELKESPQGFLYLALKFNEHPTVKKQFDFKESTLIFCAIIIAGNKKKFYYENSNMIVADAIKYASDIEELYKQNAIEKIYSYLKTDRVETAIRELARLTNNNLVRRVVYNSKTFDIDDYRHYDSAEIYKDNDDMSTLLTHVNNRTEERKKNGCLYWVIIIILFIFISFGAKGCIRAFYQTPIMQQHFKEKAYERYQREK